ncbi:SDR family NAD(P)-dependent oxidoreductase [Lacticaseibacillus rhamnosus]
MKLKDKVAIVTGAASGIGREIARTYAREVAKVAIADLDQTAAGAVCAELGRDRAMSVVMDVTDEQAVNAGVGPPRDRQRNLAYPQCLRQRPLQLLACLVEHRPHLGRAIRHHHRHLGQLRRAADLEHQHPWNVRRDV